MKLKQLFEYEISVCLRIRRQFSHFIWRIANSERLNGICSHILNSNCLFLNVIQCFGSILYQFNYKGDDNNSLFLHGNIAIDCKNGAGRLANDFDSKIYLKLIW